MVARVRPMSTRELREGCEQAVEVRGNTVMVALDGSAAEGRRCRFDKVFGPSASQVDVYDHVRPQLDAALAGFNATLFAYGQTGTGKTHTVLGIDMWQLAHVSAESEGFSPGSPRGASGAAEAAAMLTAAERKREAWGLVPRAMSYLFDRLEEAKGERMYKVHCSYLEIHNERVFDLLRYEESRALRGGLDVVQDKRRGVSVPDAVEVQVTSEEEVLLLLWKGARNRSISATDMNEHSSRSHTIFQVVIEQRPVDSATGEKRVVTRSKLNMVDLAGSEKWKTHQLTSFSEKRISELTAINQSLSNLGNCIRALGEAGRSHIPYRNSKLTRLLQDSIGGNTKTWFVVTLSPSDDAVDETLSTLQFADRAKRVVLHAKVNETEDESSMLRRYETEIARLRKLLAQAAQSGTSSSSRPAPDSAELGRVKEENLQLQDDVKRARQQVLSLRDEKRRLLRSMSAASHDDDVSAAVELLSVQTQAIDERRAELDAREADLAERQALLNKYYTWLRSLPVDDGAPELDERGDDGGGDAEGDTQKKPHDNPQRLTIRGRLALMEWSVAMQADELLRTRRLFARETSEMQEMIDERALELEEMAREAVQLRVAANSAERSRVAQSPRPSSQESPRTLRRRDGHDSLARSPAPASLTTAQASPLVRHAVQQAAAASAAARNSPRSSRSSPRSMPRRSPGSGGPVSAAVRSPSGAHAVGTLTASPVVSPRSRASPRDSRSPHGSPYASAASPRDSPSPRSSPYASAASPRGSAGSGGDNGRSVGVVPSGASPRQVAQQRDSPRRSPLAGRAPAPSAIDLAEIDVVADEYGEDAAQEGGYGVDVGTGGGEDDGVDAGAEDEYAVDAADVVGAADDGDYAGGETEWGAEDGGVAEGEDGEEDDWEEEALEQVGDWAKFLDPQSGAAYYFNMVTSATTWERPEAMGADQSLEGAEVEREHDV